MQHMGKVRRPQGLALVGLFGLLAACSSGIGDGPSLGIEGGGEPGSLPGPTGVTLTAGEGSVEVGWNAVPGAVGYAVRWVVATEGMTGAPQSFPVTSAPASIEGLPVPCEIVVVVQSLGIEGYEGASRRVSLALESDSTRGYFPPWRDNGPTEVLTFDYDPGVSSEQNGANFKSVAQSLQPGQRLEVGAGTYSIQSLFDLSLQGTEEAPIFIVAKEGETPIITRPDAGQNVINIGSSGTAEYFVLQGIEVTGGSIGVKLYDCNNVWIDQLHVHHTGANGITANAAPTHHVWYTRNDISYAGAQGEAFYIGGNNGNPIAHHNVIALNHVHHTVSGSQGDGIEVKQGSYANWVVENDVHDTSYPGILVYGTYGEQPNLVERNLVRRSGATGMQVQGDAIVRNNIVIGGAIAFSSHDHQGQVANLVVVHNTFLNESAGAQLSDWGGRPGMVFANNIVYSSNATAVNFPNGSADVTFEGNVVLGPVWGVDGGHVSGNGLQDFVGASFDGTTSDVTPLASSTLVGSGDPNFAVEEDFTGEERVPPFEVGAVELD